MVYRSLKFSMQFAKAAARANGILVSSCPWLFPTGTGSSSSGSTGCMSVVDKEVLERV